MQVYSQPEDQEAERLYIDRRTNTHEISDPEEAIRIAKRLARDHGYARITFGNATWAEYNSRTDDL